MVKPESLINTTFDMHYDQGTLPKLWKIIGWNADQKTFTSIHNITDEESYVPYTLMEHWLGIKLDVDKEVGPAKSVRGTKHNAGTNFTYDGHVWLVKSFSKDINNYLCTSDTGGDPRRFTGNLISQCLLNMERLTATERGTKHNKGKVLMSAVEPEFIRGVAEVLTFGATVKYDRDNWKKGIPEVELQDSLMRHVIDYLSGIRLDDETGLDQLYHIACNCMMLSELHPPNNKEK